MNVLCIDPGPEVSGAVIYNTATRGVSHIMPAISNGDLYDFIRGSDGYEHTAIEMIASYGMPVGVSTFETCLWIGRLMEVAGWDRCTKVYRRDVKMELCGSMKAKDGNVRQALLDRFPGTGGGATPEVGTKASPGPLYGISKHAWSALAVGVTWEAMRTRSAA